MTQYPNWNENKAKTIYTHKKNPNVFVAIRLNMEVRPKYLIIHSHPGAGNHTVVQPPEGAMNMKNARERAEKHLRHWSDSARWSSDVDFGRMGKRAT
ncbi:MAG: hypothetical protein WC932_02200 [archaeon]|jgi:hypothetical protein